ncbi:putative enoyl-CoA hydratase/carnithine racemase [Podospora australis]|uniref:Enoyl-CoA hydratase/carnithine racemase n=1 Tax=Podospora australis TaxID=1536484 RepID=A0AAN6WIW9_9PEZI|nr:putative enoyl-CoA hydratase/carnithine racemase [Podospora australis]
MSSQIPKQLTSPPPSVPNILISFPAPHVLLVTLNRPKQLNAIPSPQHSAMASLWAWYDAQPFLRCAILTGSGRAFCAGADLKEWDSRHGPDTAVPDSGSAREKERWTQEGFGGLSNRVGKKPVIAAVNGLCFGGGMEMAINCDLIVADKTKAKFGLPEVGKGVIALAGALPRLIKTVGRQRASEMALLGRVNYDAVKMQDWGLVNFVTEEGKAVEEAVKVAEEMSGNSPDAVIASREGLRLGWEGIGPGLATEVLERGMYGRIDGGENMKEGVRSFVERRKAGWVDSKL